MSDVIALQQAGDLADASLTVHEQVDLSVLARQSRQLFRRKLTDLTWRRTEQPIWLALSFPRLAPVANLPTVRWEGKWRDLLKLGSDLP